MNPHLFASPRMAAKVVRNIAEGLARIDPQGAELYRSNAREYAASLEALADRFAAATRSLPSRKIVTEHAVFDYLARDCGLEIVAVVEEAPGQEPSAAGMLELIQRIRQQKAAAVFTEPQYPGKVSRTIALDAHVPAAVLDPAATGPDQPPLDYYQSVMTANIAVLKETLDKNGTGASDTK